MGILLVSRWFKYIKRVISTAKSRLKLFLRKIKNMRQLKASLWIVTTGSILITLVIYHLYRTPIVPRSPRLITAVTTEKNTASLEDDADYKPLKHIPLDEVYKNTLENDTEYSMEKDEYAKAQMINTAGCKIPLTMVPYEKRDRKPKVDVCGQRAVFLNRIDLDRVRVTVNDHILKKNMSYSNYRCCLRFYIKTEGENENIKRKFSSCYKCENGDTFALESDFINVQCFGYDDQNESHMIYEDMYAFTKQKIPPKVEKECDEKYNILMLGMDSMSLPRFVQTMTDTVLFMKNNFWLSYRGYHKVGDNTFPNLMAALTGLNMTLVSDKCYGKMDGCNDLMIWNTFKESGYMTAYGEDHLTLPDTFSKNYTFKLPPTDHYLRPFFQLAEKTKNVDGIPYMCSGKATSGQQLLDYAYDFVSTYKNESFFGLFWMNSFSHNPMNRPEDADKMFENFFNRLFYTGALSNTFIIFFSDHGLRFGPNRYKVEGYYDDRMPFLFILPPTTFKSKYPEKYKAMAINQFRLMTPYDLYHTMMEVFDLGLCKTKPTVTVPKAFHKYQSIFSVISGNRTCQDARIHDKWCSCHKLYPLEEHDTEGAKAIQFVFASIQNKSLSVVTKPCTTCLSIKLDKVVRIHFYYDNDKVNLYYVVAIKIAPGDVIYEATVKRQESNMEIVGPINIITVYKGLGSCSLRHKDRIFCMCKNDC
ncbi:uncharacterized protein LOC123691468 isoform X2 [Colias croceus]|uniref:uncharacterized protein LOC123691468 isoform X2 n=1 Tax=Colias crocea TaxID=72248 RepID=UPI001E27D215|nr:uncharacterized protein LOC123691468 isoform X2 [Colias croceus]